MKTYFPESGEINVHIPSYLKDANAIEIIIKCEHYNEIVLTLYPDHIYINNLYKCETKQRVITGNEQLEKFKSIAKILEKKYIKLTDKSIIVGPTEDTSFSLAYYKIILAGESWYNEHGFRGANYELEKQINNTVANLNFIATMKERIHAKLAAIRQQIPSTNVDVESKKPKYQMSFYVNTVHNMSQKIGADVGNIDEKTFREIFVAIDTYLKNPIATIEVQLTISVRKMVNYTILFIKSKLSYDIDDLTWHT